MSSQYREILHIHLQLAACRMGAFSLPQPTYATMPLPCTQENDSIPLGTAVARGMSLRHCRSSFHFGGRQWPLSWMPQLEQNNIFALRNKA